MSAIAINAADLSAPSSAFVAVKTTQITVSAAASKTGKDFSSLFNKEESVQIKQTAYEAKGANAGTERDEVNTPVKESDTVGKNAASAAKSEEPLETEQITETVPTVSETEKEVKVTVTAALKISVRAVGMFNNTPVVDDNEAQDMITRCNEILEALSSLLQRFAEILEVTVEKLEGSYEELDFSFSDMLSEQKIPQLMLNLGKCDELEQVLFDEAPAQMFNDMKEALSQLFEQLDTTAKELVGLVTENVFKDTAFASEILPKGFLKLITGNETKAPEETGNEALEAETKTPEFTVTRTVTDGKDSEGDMGTATGSENINVKDTRDAGTRKSEKNDGFEEFIKGMENAVRITDSQEIPMIEGKPDVREIVMRVVDAIKVNLSPDKTSIELSLSPQSLGKISLYITSRDGNLTARIATENEVTKQALESQLEMLKETIAEQGIKVEAIEVSVAGFTFADSNNAQKGETESDNKKTGATGRKQVRDGEAGTSVQEETGTSGNAVPEGSTVNYVA